MNFENKGTGQHSSSHTASLTFSAKSQIYHGLWCYDIKGKKLGNIILSSHKKKKNQLRSSQDLSVYKNLL